MLTQTLLDDVGPHLVSSGDDQVVTSTFDPKHSFGRRSIVRGFRERAEITGVQPAVDERKGTMAITPRHAGGSNVYSAVRQSYLNIA